MTPERWDRLTELFETALQCQSQERSAFLARACAGDAELRTEVESLIAEHESAGDFLNRPAMIEASFVLRESLQDGSGPAELDSRVGITVSNRYQIEGSLGRGGQALVYRARDLMLMSKPVVVKILATMGQNASLHKRFQHEVEALSRIDHPGVVGVLDMGNLPDGSPFLVMQYAEGITLRQALESGPLETTRAAAILRQIGAALEAVHAIGVAHRDLKPENIILQRLSDGAELVKLIDFGIAKVEKSGVASETTTGLVAGSLRYMAPEQFQGENSRASDIYALGLIACEVLCGHPDIRALRAHRRIHQSIRAALAYRPQDRPASAKDFCSRLVDALLRPWRLTVERSAAAVVAAVFIIWALWGWLPTGTDRITGEIQTLAILPFEMLEPSAEIGALEVGVADALITRLSNISGLIVRPISTVRRYHNSTIDPVRAARELQVDAIVEGTLQSSETGIRANVRLIRAEDGGALWAGTVESKTGHLFTLEDSIAQQIALNVNARLSDSERRKLESRDQLNPEAHELYVRGRFEWGNRSGDGFEKAAEYFRRAIDLDPTYARAHVGLADCFLLLGGYSHHPQLEMLPKAKALALRALELDPSLGEAHATLGLISQNLDWDWKNVERHYRQSIALAPNYATGHHWYAEFLSIQGRFEESRSAFAQARRIDPISPIIQVDEAQLYFFERQYQRSLDILDRVAQTDPNFELVHERIALIKLAQGREEEAWQKIQRLTDCREEASDCRRFWTASLPTRDPAAARAALLWIEGESKKRRIPPSVLVRAHARQGNYSRALDWLDYMVENHEVWLITSKVNPLFDPLRTQPRFERVLQKLNLAN
jgi:serine/threonine-protein kinase